MISPLPKRSVTIIEDLASRDNFLEIGADVSLPAGDGHMMMRASQLVHGDHASVNESKPQDNVLMPIDNQENRNLLSMGQRPVIPMLDIASQTTGQTEYS